MTTALLLAQALENCPVRFPAADGLGERNPSAGLGGKPQVYRDVVPLEVKAQLGP